MNIWKKISDLWPVHRKRSRFRKVLIVQAGTEVLKAVAASDVVLVRSGNYDKWLRFNCPNNCGITIILDLSPARWPHWAVSLHDNGTISVQPSVVNKEYGAHFIIRQNTVIWI